MSRNSNVALVKPMLEELEQRSLPSFILDGAYQQLLPPLNALMSDMQNAQADLNNQYQAMVALGPGTTNASNRAAAQIDFGKAVADWSRMLVDQQTIQWAVNTDINFIHAAAWAEALEGDPTDLMLLYVGPYFGFHATADWTNISTQANDLINESNVQAEVNTNLSTVAPIDANVSIADEAYVTF